MTKKELTELVHREIREFRYEVPQGALGNPIPRHEVDRQLSELKAALVDPSLERIELQPPDPPGEAELWVVAVDHKGGFKVFYDPENDEFCLAMFGETGPPHSIGVRGDLVGTFMAR